MADKLFENNQVTMIGEIVSEFEFSHEVYGEGFYLVDISVSRLSDSVDYIPLMVSERLVDVTQSYIGETISVSGQFRSYNRHEEKKNRLILSVFVRELEFVDEIEDDIKSNQIYLDGYICKEPIYSWGRNARYASSFEVGSHVEVYGRIQSREYIKKIGEEQTEKRVAYEVSVNKIEFLE